MEATLIKSENSYILKDGLNHVLGIDDKKLKDRLECPYLLSKQNCDELFGVVDVDKLAKQFTVDESYGEISGDLFKGYIYGFNKAMELYQPTEIEVEIEMELEIDTSKLIGAIYGHKPKLDSEGCLILKKM